MRLIRDEVGALAGGGVAAEHRRDIQDAGGFFVLVKRQRRCGLHAACGFAEASGVVLDHLGHRAGGRVEVPHLAVVLGVAHVFKHHQLAVGSHGDVVPHVGVVVERGHGVSAVVVAAFGNKIDHTAGGRAGDVVKRQAPQAGAPNAGSNLVVDRVELVGGHEVVASQVRWIPSAVFRAGERGRSGQAQAEARAVGDVGGARRSVGRWDFQAVACHKHEVIHAVGQTSFVNFRASVGLGAHVHGHCVVVRRAAGAAVAVASHDGQILRIRIGQQVFPGRPTSHTVGVAVGGLVELAQDVGVALVGTAGHMSQRVADAVGVVDPVGAAHGFFAVKEDVFLRALARRGVVERTKRWKVCRAEAGELDWRAHWRAEGHLVGRVPLIHVDHQVSAGDNLQAALVDDPGGDERALCAMSAIHAFGAQVLVVDQHREGAVAVVEGANAVRHAFHFILAVDQRVARSSASCQRDAVAHAQQGHCLPVAHQRLDVRRVARTWTSVRTVRVAFRDRNRFSRRRTQHRSGARRGQGGSEGAAGAEASAVDHWDAHRLARGIGGEGHRHIALSSVIRTGGRCTVGGVQDDRHG